MEELPRVVNKYVICQVVIDAVERDDAEQEDSGPQGRARLFSEVGEGARKAL